MSGMIAEAVAALLARHGTPAFVRAVEAGGSPAALEDALRDGGFLAAMADEAQGGAGLGWPELFHIVFRLGACAAPLPLAQTLVAHALLPDPDTWPGAAAAGMVTFAAHLAADEAGGWHAAEVPFARTAAWVLAAQDGRLLWLRVADAACDTPVAHGALAATLRWPAGAAVAAGPVPAGVDLNAIGAVLHAALMAGAMQRAFDLTLAWANERVQFGRPIGKYQAIQHQIAVMAQQVAATRIAAETAFVARAQGFPPVAACAVAKARAGEAAQVVAATAHAVHGAIGITAEYELQLHTRRLHEWRLAHGSEHHWARRLGAAFLAAPGVGTADFVRGLAD